MSRAAITWYIEGFWRIQKGDQDFPKVEVNMGKTEYTIWLPILERNDEK